jgi:hypothetical protein
MTVNYVQSLTPSSFVGTEYIFFESIVFDDTVIIIKKNLIKGISLICQTLNKMDEVFFMKS